jgi:hypothetical protein
MYITYFLSYPCIIYWKYNGNIKICYIHDILSYQISISLQMILNSFHGAYIYFNHYTSNHTFLCGFRKYHLIYEMEKKDIMKDALVLCLAQLPLFHHDFF